MRHDELYLADLVDSTRAVREYLDGISREHWDEDRVLRNAVLYRLLLLGEIASALPDAWRDRYPDVAWRQIRAFRNLAVHKYFSVDWAVVWQISREEVPVLEEQAMVVALRHPGLPPRTLVIEHAFLADAGTRARAVRLGVGITVQHPLLYSLGGNLVRYWGTDRASQVMPVRAWVDEGALTLMAWWTYRAGADQILNGVNHGPFGEKELLHPGRALALRSEPGGGGGRQLVGVVVAGPAERGESARGVQAYGGQGPGSWT